MTKQSYRQFEHVFLFRLAPTWLRCRLAIMTHDFENWDPKVPPWKHLEGAMLGEFDYAYGMKLLVKEMRESEKVFWRYDKP